MLPTKQCFETHDTPAGDIDKWLVVQCELVLAQRTLQRAFQLMTTLQGALYLGSGSYRRGGGRRIPPIQLRVAAELGEIVALAIADPGLEFFKMTPLAARELPLFRQTVGKLQDFHVIERLLEDDEPFGTRKSGADLTPGVVRIRGAQDNQHVRVLFPQPGNGLQAVPSGRHARIDERNGVRLIRLSRLTDHTYAVLSLKCAIDLEYG